ncbi:ExeM/NucH family extracellular endonuclease [Algicola sagamiensis]|uniref:ExeM/NucH family extracellular endonuclease n=1 Tax=Algicola sagamiensis TaxID=163869 RepID=UPI0003A3DB6F|nr:ExeM/NucH family extracellular endonuclease [Algicola sagamiensis]
MKKPLVWWMLGLTNIVVQSQLEASVFISEYVEGSALNKAIEIYNPTEETINLSQYKIQMYFNGQNHPQRTIQLRGMVDSHQTFVLANSDASEAILRVAQQTDEESWFNGDDAIILTHQGQIVDRFGTIGVDPGDAWSSGGIYTKDRTLRRHQGIQTGDLNAHAPFYPDHTWDMFAKNDFSGLGKHNTNDDPDTPDLPEPTCGEPVVRIHEIQGNQLRSPMLGQRVDVEAIVSALYLGDDKLNGFFIQEKTGNQDTDSSTSEGLFVYTTTQQPQLQIGDHVRVRGRIAEFKSETQLSQVESINICDQGHSITPTFLPLPFAHPLEIEALEGMLITNQHPWIVNHTYRLGFSGQLTLGSERLMQPTEIALPGEEANRIKKENEHRQIVLNDGSKSRFPSYIPFPLPGLSSDNTVRSGDTVTSLIGILGQFDQYQIHPIETVHFTQTNPRPRPLEKGDAYRIGVLNVQNYFNGNGQGGGFPTPRGASTPQELARQTEKLINSIWDSESALVGLVEIENDGFGEHSAIADFTHRFNQRTNQTFQFVRPQGLNRIGDDAITVALLYNTQIFDEVGQAKVLHTFPFDYHNRQPLAQSFKNLLTGEIFTVAVNHFKSKRCNNPTGQDRDQQDGQGCWNATRTTAAKTLAAWLNTYPTGIQDEDILIIGDLNAYSMEDPVRAIESSGYNNLLKRDKEANNYTYIYDGYAGALDHALATHSLAEKINRISVWHTNSDEPRVLDYNLENKTPSQQQDYYSEGPFRAADHDMILLDMARKVVPYQQINPKLWSFFRPWRHYSIQIPEGATLFEVSIAGGIGDADLYIRHEAIPSHQDFDCRPYLWGNNEQCLIQNPKPGLWHIALHNAFPYFGTDITIQYQ